MLQAVQPPDGGEHAQIRPAGDPASAAGELVSFRQSREGGRRCEGELVRKITEDRVADCRPMQSFLGRAIDPPSVFAMDRAWLNLKALGAVGEDDELTALGKHMVRPRSAFRVVSLTEPRPPCHWIFS